MKPTIEQLQNTDCYELIDSFRIDEMAQFRERELGLSKSSAMKLQKPTKKGAGSFCLG